jgi:serine/threonine protein kinase
MRQKRRYNENFDDKQIFEWMKELINGLYYLKMHNIIHRDIKPEYVIILFYFNFINYFF